MKSSIIGTLLSLSMLAINPVHAHPDGTVQDAWGRDITTGTGDCVVFGSPEAGICHGGSAPATRQSPPPMTSADDASSMSTTSRMSTSSSSSSTSSSRQPVVREVINLKGVVFETNSNILNASSYARLDQAVQTLQANPEVKVIVAGHTDNAGDALYNLSLSEKRAVAVRNYLISKGVDGSRLIARGYGETEPFASNDTAAGRATNRRVELRILE